MMMMMMMNRDDGGAGAGAGGSAGGDGDGHCDGDDIMVIILMLMVLLNNADPDAADPGGDVITGNVARQQLTAIYTLENERLETKVTEVEGSDYFPISTGWCLGSSRQFPGWVVERCDPFIENCRVLEMTSSRLFDESGDLLENHTLVLHEPLGFLIFFSKWKYQRWNNKNRRRGSEWNPETGMIWTSKQNSWPY